MRVPFGVGSYESESRPLSSQRIVNGYLEEAPALAKTPVAIPRAAGLKPFSVIDTVGDFRGAIKHAEQFYTVHAGTLYRVDPAGAETSLGSITGTDRCFLSSNGTQLAISASGQLYVYESTLAAVTDPDFPAVSWNDFLDGYTIFGFEESGQFGITAINDSTDFDALDYATAEAAPSKTIRGIVDHRELFQFSADDFEVWFNSGSSDFPFERTASGYGEVGIAGKYAIGKKANSLYFLGGDGIAYRLEGYNPVRISSNAVEAAFRSYDRTQCVVETWTERGHAFVGFRFPTAFWVHDIGTTLWHERESYNQARYRADFITQCYQKWYVGGLGRIGELDPNTYAEFDQPQIVSCTSPAISGNGGWLEHDRVELVFETGVGLNLGQGSAPQVILQWSNDGGRTFPNERVGNLGAIGEFKVRVVFTRLGRSRDRVYRYIVSDPVKLWFLYATLNEWD